jgi:uncharacterized circularly permuted ATP-grasp superfamily protein
VKDAPPLVHQDHENKQDLEHHGGDDEEVHGDEGLKVVVVPDLIKYYMGEEPLLPQVPTYLGIRPKDFTYIREHARELVIKTTGDAGGYGMLMGPFASAAQIDAYVARMSADPGNYIAGEGPEGAR